MTQDQFDVLMRCLGFGFGSVFFGLLILLIDRWSR